MAAHRIKLTDGTTTIDLYAGDIKLREGGLALAPPKLDTSYLSGPYSDGDSLANLRYGNRTISLRLKCTGSSLADLKTNIRQIQRLLNDAHRYAQDPYRAQGLITANNKVRLELQWGDSAGSSTFFEVVNGRLEMPASFYSAILTSGFIVLDANLILECKPFGLYTAQDLSSIGVVNGKPINGAIYAARLWDGAAYTDETTDINDVGADDVALMDATPAVNDAFYFGLPTRANALPILIGTAGVGTWTITWEYWNGTTWAALAGVTDATVGFTAAPGWHHVTWTVPTSWPVSTIDGATCHWIRARVSAFTAITTQPLGTQAYYDVAGPLNYVDIATAEGYGDVPAGLCLKVSPLTGTSGTVKCWVAKRSGLRYNDSLWTEGEDSTTTTDIAGGGAFSEPADALQSAGYYTQYLKSTSAIVETIYGRWNYVIANPPRGAFRVLARVRVDGSAGGAGDYAKMIFGLGYLYGAASKTPATANGEYYHVAADQTWEVIDLGLINIPPTPESDVYANNSIELRIFFGCDSNGLGGAANHYWQLDYIFLLPVDEGMAVIDSLNTTQVFVVDSASDPANVYLIDANSLVSGFPTIVGAPFTLGRETTRIYFLRNDLPAAAYVLSGKYQPRFLTL